MDGEPRRSARIAQRRLNLVEPAVMANPVVLRNPVQLMPLVVGQQAVNDGQAEGGLAQELGADALAAYFRTDGRLPVAAASQMFSEAPRAMGAQAALLKVFESLCRHLRAYKMCHKSQEERAALWVESFFTNAAKTAFQTAAGAARLVDSTSGISRGSVLYRTMLGMLALYDNPQARREGQIVLATLAWKENVTATQLHADAVFLQYQALAAATATNPAATKASALTWDREYDLLHAILPVWAKKVIVAYPELFDSRANLWIVLGRHEPAEAVPDKAGRLFAVADIEDHDEAARLEEEREKAWRFLLPPAHYGDFDPALALCAIMARNGEPLQCFRCKGNHRVVNCPEVPSQAEKDGQPRQLWRARPMPPAGMPPPPARPFAAPVPYVRPTINALTQSQEHARIEQLESTVASLANMMNAMVQDQPVQPETSSAPIMALSTPAPPLLVGEGPAPPGYVGIGTSQDGRPLWARSEEEDPVAFEALN